MSRDGQAGFLDYFQRELEFLDQEGKAFAEQFPAVAGRLQLGDQATPDPHVERLRQSFAFLTSRIHAKLDDDYPELSSAMLGVLYPQLSSPVPSMAMVEVGLDLGQTLPPSGKSIPHGAAFTSRAVGGQALRFRSAGATTLWPIQVKALRVDSPSSEEQSIGDGVRAMLRLTLEAPGEHVFGDLELETLRLYFKGPLRTACELHEAACARVVGVRVHTASTTFDLEAGAVQPGGLGEEEAMLESPRRSFAGYRLLQEYFAFPQRFLFAEVEGLGRLRGKRDRELHLDFALSREFDLDAQDVDASCVSLSCIPLVNLFPKMADAVPVDGRQAEFPVQPDGKKPLDFEIHSVTGITGQATQGETELQYAPFYSVQHSREGAHPDAYWITERRASTLEGDAGTDLWLRFVDLEMRRTSPVERLLHVRTLCSNRDLPIRVQDWGGARDFTIDGVNGIESVRCVHSPTSSKRLSGAGALHWRLISHLSLNYLSLIREGRDALCEILRTYDFEGSAASVDQINGIHAVESETVLRWLHASGGAGYARGTSTKLVLDRRRFVGSSPFLFATVIERFLALYCSINSFSEMSLSTFDRSPDQQEEVFRWPARTGTKPVL